jgi:hypothetical protein
MSLFQGVLAGLFLFTLVLTYVKQLAPLVKLAVPAFFNDSAPKVQPSIAVSLVADIKSVTELRDRLAAEGCEDGVTACTTLLRVIVEYQQPSKGVV